MAHITKDTKKIEMLKALGADISAGIILCRRPRRMRSVFWRPRKARAGEMYAYVRQATARRVNITTVSILSSREAA